MQRSAQSKRSVVLPIGAALAGLATVALIWPNGDPDGGDGVRSGVGKGEPHIIEVIVRTDAGKAHITGSAVSNVRNTIYADNVTVTSRTHELPYTARFTVYDDESVSVRVESRISDPSGPALTQCEIRLDGRRPNTGKPYGQVAVPSRDDGSVSCHYNFVGNRLR